MEIRSLQIKGCLLLGRKVMTNLDSILKSRDIILLAKIRIMTELSLLKPLAVCNPPPPKPYPTTPGTYVQGKAGLELRQGRHQWRLPGSLRQLLPGEGA